MAEPTNKYANKVIDAVDSKVKDLNFKSLNKKWGDLSKADEKKKSSANGPDPHQEAEQYCEELDLDKVDNNNKDTKTPVLSKKQEAKGKFENSGLPIEKLNKGEWGYTGKEDGKKKSGAGKGKFNG